MAQRKYTDQEKARVMGALVESAALCGGTPDHRRIAQSEGMPYTTVKSWWARTPEEERCRIASIATQARQESWRDGGQAWFTEMQDSFRDKVKGIMERDWSEEELKDASRSAETVGRILRDHRVSMGLTDAVEELGDVEEQMRERMQRAGMLKEG